MKRETVGRKLAEMYANDDDWLYWNESVIGNFKKLKEALFEDLNDGDYEHEEPEKYFYFDKNGNKAEENDCYIYSDSGFRIPSPSSGIKQIKNPEWTKWYKNELDAWAKRFAKEHDFKTKDDWYGNSYELSGVHWYESENELAEIILEGLFCDMTDEELIEDYNRHARDPINKIEK